MAFGQTLDLTLGAAPGTGANPAAKPESGGIAYQISTIYKPGDIVTDNGNGYIAIAPSKGALPSTHAGEWKLFGASGGAQDLVSGTTYKVNDLVTEAGSLYLVINSYVSGANAAVDVASGSIVQVGKDSDVTTFISTIAPANAPDNSLWYNLRTNKLYIKYNDGTTTSWLSL